MGTRNYLSSLRNLTNGVSLPEGPILFSPKSLLLEKIDQVKVAISIQEDEVHVEKAKTIEDVYGIAVGGDKTISLKDVIVSGYGNKDSDSRAYKDAGITEERIWQVNPAGELKNIGENTISSYGEQLSVVETLYPLIAE